MRLDLVDLQFFILLAESNSLSRAAERFPMALSAASQRLKKMESIYGVRLVERHSRGISLSPAGEVLLFHARSLLQATEKMNGDMGEMSLGLPRSIRISGNTMACSVFLPDKLGRFLASEPDVDLQLSEHPSREIVGQIEQGAIDIGILDGSMAAAKLTQLPFARDRLVIIAAGRHPLASRCECQFTEVLDQPFVGLPHNSAMQCFMQDMARLKGHSLRIRVRAPNFQALASLVAEGCGLGILPAQSARQLAPLYGLGIIKLSDNWAERELKIAFRDWQALPAHARRLVEALLSTT
ncbi:LysR substrate-binding domain-containing protein [Craterilacuibacter sp.]|uniref:LysR family transcriptional regulator n=1 Tax=Craterilacuibacter sp. TaxID=2870909 RepID=UPI003F35D14A